MEAPKTAPPQSQNLPPSQPPMNRKRPLDISKSQNSPYNKMRLIVKDLRPHVIELETWVGNRVLAVAELGILQGCAVFKETTNKNFQELNLLIDLYKEVMEETVNPEVAKDAPGAQNSSVDIMDEEKPSEQQKDMKPPPESEASVKPEGDSSEKQEAEDDGVQGTGTYVVGGSAFGWNFITYTSGKAIYYGRTKESFRSSYVKSE
ncbi:hypothetical protein H5410_028487 [Solanum commersonii]|uniref:Uncharacterized protein n=1 Tax=Solanum commersonii TaxID=4109 RepID=A0A9J5Z235_SOLCO|nr:hypothetical protein H5410_028487 [Solanum commersonii]